MYFAGAALILTAALLWRVSAKPVSVRAPETRK